MPAAVRPAWTQDRVAGQNRENSLPVNHHLASCQDHLRAGPRVQPDRQSWTKHAREPERELIAQNKGSKSHTEDGWQRDVARSENQCRSWKRHRKSGACHDGEDDDQAVAGDKAKQNFGRRAVSRYRVAASRTIRISSSRIRPSRRRHRASSFVRPVPVARVLGPWNVAGRTTSPRNGASSIP